MNMMFAQSYGYLRMLELAVFVSTPMFSLHRYVLCEKAVDSLDRNILLYSFRLEMSFRQRRPNNLDKSCERLIGIFIPILPMWLRGLGYNSNIDNYSFIKTSLSEFLAEVGEIQTGVWGA